LEDTYKPSVELGQRRLESNLRRVRLIRFLLPLILFVIVLSYETWEHMLAMGQFKIDIHWTSEVLFFGILGPSAVFAVLSYVVRVLELQKATNTRIAHFNRQLESKVQERTEELSEINRELAFANQELQTVDEMKSDFVALVSHELRTPLTALNGGLELVLRDEEEIPDRARHALSVMAQESERLTGLVKTILNVSQLEAGRLKLNPGPVAATPLLDRAANHVMSRSSHLVDNRIGKDLPPVWADEIYLEEIVRNLLTNADKYSPEGEPVIIEARSNGEQMSISITDCGPGISAEEQLHVFDRFYRGVDEKKAGWGLGLYFARLLTEAQGGSLTITSPVDGTSDRRGTRMTVTLPIATETPEDG